MKKMFLIVMLVLAFALPHNVEAKSRACRRNNPRCEWVMPDRCSGLDGKSTYCKGGGK